MTTPKPVRVLPDWLFMGIVITVAAPVNAFKLLLASPFIVAAVANAVAELAVEAWSEMAPVMKDNVSDIAGPMVERFNIYGRKQVYEGRRHAWQNPELVNKYVAENKWYALTLRGIYEPATKEEP